MDELTWRGRTPELVAGGHSGPVVRCTSCTVVYVALDGQYLFRGAMAGAAAAVEDGWWQPEPQRPRPVLCPECVHAADRISDDDAIEARLSARIAELGDGMDEARWYSFVADLAAKMTVALIALGQGEQCAEFIETAAQDALR